jgi:hypothetical protein
MADYYGASIAHGYAAAGDDIAKGITAAFAQSQKQHHEAEGVQGLLDIAKRMQIPDQKSGKPTNFFKDEQLQYVQRLIDNKKYHAAGQAEAALGIGKDMYNRIQTAAAKQQDAIAKQQRIQQQINQGPILATVPGHGTYMGNPNTGTYSADTNVPRNAMGMTAEQQLNMQKGVNKDANAAATAQFKAQEYAKSAQTKIFNAYLKSSGISSPTDLFDPSIQQGGVFDSRTGFVQTDPTAGPQSHIRIYHKPPETDDKGKVILNAQGNPVGARAGVVLPTSQVVDMQNAAASMAGPQAVQALQWLRQNPTNEHASAVAAEISKRMGQVDQAPEPKAFDPTPPSQLPASPPAAAFQTGDQPVTGGGDDESQVSQEAADQNPGY